MAGPSEIKTGDWYLIGEQRVLAVTAALDALDASALRIWAGNLAGQHAVDNIPALVAAMRVKPCDETKRDDRCGQCLDCWRVKIARQHFFRSEDAKRRGSAVHDVIEHWALHDGSLPQYDEAYQPYVDAFLRLVEEYGLTPDAWLMAEATVCYGLGTAHRYAGTLDGIVRFDPVTDAARELCGRINHSLGRPSGQPVTLVVDTKSREGAGAKFYSQQPLQLAAYRHARQIVRRDGAMLDMVATDGGAVLQLRPDGVTVRPVLTRKDVEWCRFISVLEVAYWLRAEDGGDKAHQVGMFPLPDDVAKKKAAPRKKAAPAKKAAAKAAPANPLPSEAPPPVKASQLRLPDGPPRGILASLQKPPTDTPPLFPGADDDIPF